MRLATAQSKIEENIEHNAEQIKDLVLTASAKDADFVHFPECALSGYIKTQIKSWSDVDWGLLNSELNKIQKLCAQESIGAAVGSAHNHPAIERPFNSLYIINEAGELSARYDKRFCSHSEISDWFAAGDQPVVVDVKGIRLGFALCIEMNFPEIFMAYNALGADAVLLSAYHDDEMFKIQAQGHAACNNLWMSYSVPTNMSKIQPSCIIGPDGKVIGSCKNGSNDIILNEINPDAEQWDVPCKKARPWRKIARERLRG